MKSRTTGSYVALALAVVGTLLLICSRSVAVECAYPAEHAGRAIRTGIWSRVVGFFKSAEANAENVRLRREVASLEMLKGDVDRLETENARLRRALDYVAHAPGKWEAAGVLSHGGAAGVHDVLRVDKGSLAGVRKGAVVASPGGLVGLVTSVSPHTSEVTLITDPSVKVACEILTRDPGLGSVFGILEGGGTHLISAETGASILYLINPLRIRHLKRRPNLPSRAPIITSGLGGVFPRGLTVGYLIDGCDEDETLLEREGDVEPAVDFPTLEDVFIRRAD